MGTCVSGRRIQTGTEAKKGLLGVYLGENRTDLAKELSLLSPPKQRLRDDLLAAQATTRAAL